MQLWHGITEVLSTNEKFRQIVNIFNSFYRELAYCTLVQGRKLITNKKHINKLEMRSVERGICPIATSTMNELFQ